MRVFKTCFQVIQKHAASLLLYVAVFAFISVAVSGAARQTDQDNFSVHHTHIAFYSDDGDTVLVRGLKDGLRQNVEFVAVPDTQQARQDALFYRNVNYILRVPKGFTQNFMAGGKMQLQRTAAPKAEDAYYMDFVVQRYLRLAAVARAVPGASQEQVTASVQKSLSHQSVVEMRTFGAAVQTKPQTYYCRYLAYVLMAVIVLGVSSILLVFQQPDLQRRIFCSPIKLLHQNAQMMLAMLTFSFAVYLFLFCLQFLFYGGDTLDAATPWLLLNGFAYMLVCMGSAYLIGMLVHSWNAQNAVANVLALGLSFLCGVFVERDLLSATVQQIASFLPTWWYVDAVSRLDRQVDFSATALQPVITAILIQFVFAVVLFVLALVVAKQKRTNENMTCEDLAQ